VHSYRVITVIVNAAILTVHQNTLRFKNGTLFLLTITKSNVDRF